MRLQGREPVFDERHIIARFGGGPPEGLTESFDTLCAGLVDKAVDSADAELKKRRAGLFGKKTP
jgi:hypothetical protein